MAQASPQTQHIQDVSINNSKNNQIGTFHNCTFPTSHNDADQDNVVKRRAKVLDHLRLTDPADDRDELQTQKGRRVPGTCQWIQDHPDYRDWLQGDCAQLWISGGPGTGKTMLSIFITESLEVRKERVAYFFCRHDGERWNTETSVLRGLLTQLLCTISDQLFNQFVWPSFHSDKAASYTLSRPQTIWNVFQSLVTSQDSTPTFCVLDGLDECDKDSSRQLAQRFHDLFTMNEAAHSTATFKLAVTSRDANGFRGFSKIQLEECDLQIRHDIELFIDSRIQDALSHKNDFDDWIIKRISDDLRNRSEGSFLWIGFVVRDLSRYRTTDEVMKALKRTPKGLEEQYRRILRHIFEDHHENRQEIQALLAWAALAFVPLTLPQFARAVMGSVSRKHGERIKDLLLYCEQLLVLSHKTGVIRLVHSSAEEFLAQPHAIMPTNSVTDRTHVDAGHQIITRTCLNIVERMAKSDVLKQYAVKFLPLHMKACTAADISREFSRPFFTAENILQSHWEKWRSSQPYPDLFYPEATPSPLHIATYWGVIPWAQHQLQARSIWDIVLRRSHLESKDANGLTPLAIAVREQNVPMANWLLQQGAILQLEVAIPEDAQEHGYGNTRGKSPLVLALQVHQLHSTLEHWLEKGSVEIASLLLSHLNKPTWRSIRQSRALVEAMDTSSQVPAQWLLDWMPPPPKHSRTHFKCQALVFAVRMGHVKICEQLLDCGADIYSSWEPGRNAVADGIAFGYGNERMLNLLFDEYDKRISTSCVGNRRDILLQPLTRIPKSRFYEIPFSPDRRMSVEDHWSDIEEGQTNALVIAAYHNRGLELCLKRGSFGRFSDSGYSGRVELIGGVLSGRVEQVLTLLRHGANVNTVDKHGNSILILAMHFGIWEMAEVLLGHGARVNPVGRAETTPLTEAVRKKPIKAPNRFFPTAERILDFLSNFRKEKLKTVLRLLQFGASTHWRTSAGETALSLAANLADADTVSILVERGGRISIEDPILDRGLWRWFIVTKILRMRGILSNRRCSKLLSARLQRRAKGRLPSKPWPVYYHFEEDFVAACISAEEREESQTDMVGVLAW